MGVPLRAMRDFNLFKPTSAYVCVVIEPVDFCGCTHTGCGYGRVRTCICAQIEPATADNCNVFQSTDDAVSARTCADDILRGRPSVRVQLRTGA